MCPKIRANACILYLLQGGGTIVGQDGMNLTGEIPIGTNPPIQCIQQELKGIRIQGQGHQSNSHQRLGRNDSDVNRSGSTSISFHTSRPKILSCIIDTGAQRSCIGENTFKS